MDRDTRNHEPATSTGIEYPGPERRVGSARRVSAEQSSALESTLNEALPAPVHVGRFQWDAANRIVCSDELYGICGRTPAECGTLEAVLTCVHPHDRSQLEAVVDCAIRDRQPFRMRARITRPDGRIRVLDWTGLVRLGPARQMVGLDGFCCDVTEQEKAGERARADLARHQLLLKCRKDCAISILNPEGQIVTWNDAAEHIHGYRAEEIIGERMSRLYGPADVARGHPAHLLQVAVTEGRTEDSGWRVRKNGTWFWADVAITALRDETGWLQGFRTVTCDAMVYELRQLAAHFLAALRLLEPIV